MTLSDQINTAAATRVSRRVMVFSDFDGTISTHDTGTTLIDHCMGRANREKLDQDILQGRRTFRDAVIEMWSSVRLTQAEAHQLLKDVMVDPSFEAFLDHCDSRSIPVTVLSAGLDIIVLPMLRAALGLRADSLETVLNAVKFLDDGQWAIQYFDDSEHGHDKAASITRISKRFRSQLDATTQTDSLAQVPPLIVFIGDGVSDVPCARVCDRLYAKRGKDLEKYCVQHGLPHVVFDTFEDLLQDFSVYVQEHMGSGNGLPN
ncbi:HAD-like domain-containing protein [Catenaria anguillulae PL171]|uniref:HAD-like domain-containing protein n=1 Tax=Catenaria anguillulae PL171 TaxID=765915 RepID=A0A1Y2I504_9FUNG|nr:HAD-like domain-containing protein [Catenaria anguillulae PL171]